MKKSIKIILCITLVVLMCFGMCSCNALDEAKKNVGHYSDDYTEITLGDKVYKACPKELVEAFARYRDENDDIYNSYYESELYIIDKDTPVLLNYMFGDSAEIFNDNIIWISTDIPEEELKSAKCKVFQYDGISWDTNILKNEITYYSYTAFYFAEEDFKQLVDYASNYKETNFGEYSEDKNEIYLNGKTYIKAPEDLHKKYDDYNKSIFDVIDYNYEYGCAYISFEDESSTMYEIHEDRKVLYSYNWTSSTFNSYSDLKGGILYDYNDLYGYYNEEFDEYYYYAYYFREDVYDNLVDKLMNE